MVFGLHICQDSFLLKEFVPSSLCLECGLCCNGVIFGSVKLQPDDRASRLRSLGLPVRDRTFRQPCAAWQNCRCAIYSDRPSHCRHFDCLLLKEVAAKAISHDQALKTIRRAQKKVARVRNLLSALDAIQEGGDLRSQYRRVSTLVESKTLSSEEAAAYGRLTLEFHALDQLLRASFYRESQ